MPCGPLCGTLPSRVVGASKRRLRERRRLRHAQPRRLRRPQRETHPPPVPERPRRKLDGAFVYGTSCPIRSLEDSQARSLARVASSPLPRCPCRGPDAGLRSGRRPATTDWHVLLTLCVRTNTRNMPHDEEGARVARRKTRDHLAPPYSADRKKSAEEMGTNNMDPVTLELRCATRRRKESSSSPLGTSGSATC